MVARLFGLSINQTPGCTACGGTGFARKHRPFIAVFKNSVLFVYSGGGGLVSQFPSILRQAGSTGIVDETSETDKNDPLVIVFSEIKRSQNSQFIQIVQKAKYRGAQREPVRSAGAGGYTPYGGLRRSLTARLHVAA